MTDGRGLRAQIAARERKDRVVSSAGRAPTSASEGGNGNANPSQPSVSVTSAKSFVTPYLQMLLRASKSAGTLS